MVAQIEVAAHAARETGQCVLPQLLRPNPNFNNSQHFDDARCLIILRIVHCSCQHWIVEYLPSMLTFVDGAVAASCVRACVQFAVVCVQRVLQ